VRLVKTVVVYSLDGGGEDPPATVLEVAKGFILILANWEGRALPALQSPQEVAAATGGRGWDGLPYINTALRRGLTAAAQ
jgi:hypothetical protein